MSSTDEGQDLIERYFVYRDEWADSRLYRCTAGHVSLTVSLFSLEGNNPPMCYREAHGFVCGLKMSEFVPDDEGLTTLEWAKRLLRRDGLRLEEGVRREVRLEKAVRDLIALIELGNDVQKNLALIKARPEVKKALERG